MQIVPGSRLGPYEIESHLGAGGMGEVWRARDTRLGRSVAIKVLPEELAGDAKLRIRFEREAKVISSLNHPHICTLYDVGDDYLVMELLDGETLAERVERGPMPIADLVRYGHQITDALDRAHRAGIVHRDLKPRNIMLTKSGAKLLDFGLARAERQVVIGNDGPSLSSVTEAGTIIGTFQYMAPEQLDGKRADARTDIFALGCVLHEMATGRPAFNGTGNVSLIAAIVAGQPEKMSSLQPLVPQALEHVVQKCLEKDPDDRWQSAHDVAEELCWIGRELEREVAARRESRRAHRPVVSALAALVTIFAIVIALALALRERARPAPAVAFTIVSAGEEYIVQAVLSPDGESAALMMRVEGAPDYALAIRHIDSLEPRKIGRLTSPQHGAWSPDGKWFAYFNGGKLLRIPTAGGPAETVCAGVSYGMGITWAGDTILFSPRVGEGLYRVPANGGGRPERVTTLDAKRRESLHGWPKFLPDGKKFLFVIHTVGDEQNEIHAGTLDGKHTRVIYADSLVGFARGSVVFVRDGSMFAQRFDERKNAVEGEPRRIAQGVYYSEVSSSSFATVAENGAILYFPLRLRPIAVEWRDGEGRRLGKAFEEVDLHGLHFSRDGTKLQINLFDAAKGATDIYTLDLARGVRTRVTGGRADHHVAGFSANGDRIYFSSDRAGMYDVYSQIDDGTLPPETVWRTNDDKTLTDVSPDGRFLLVLRFTPETRSDLWLYPLTPGGGAPRAIVDSDANETSGVWSPDGKWLAFISDRSGRGEVYVRPFPTGRSVQVSMAGANGLAWRHDGRLAFLSLDNVLHESRITANGDVPRTSKPDRLFALDPTTVSWEPSPIADRFLVALNSDPMDQVTLLNYVRKEW